MRHDGGGGAARTVLLRLLRLRATRGGGETFWRWVVEHAGEGRRRLLGRGILYGARVKVCFSV